MNTTVAYSVSYATTYARIERTEWTRDASGAVVNVRQLGDVLVHRGEYRHWDA